MAENEGTGETTEGAEGAEGGEGAAGDTGGGEVNLQAQVDKWKAMARKHEGQAKANSAAAKRLEELENASKSDIQKATDSAAQAEARAAEAEARVARYEVALEKSVPPKLMKFLAGGTREEIEASADELLAAVKPDTGGETTTGGRPREALRAGAANGAEPEEDDPREIAAKVSRDRF